MAPSLLTVSRPLISLMVSVDVRHHVYVNRSASTDSKHSTIFRPNWVVQYLFKSLKDPSVRVCCGVCSARALK